ncbi:MAG: gamma-glutamyltransferase family protein, partial [Vulcanimicrobiaceae bacterium]
LETIAKDGPQSFYRGEFAGALDRYARESGALLRAEDLAGYEARWREPLRSTYRGYELIGQPPVSVGVAVLEAMQILEQLPIEGLSDVSVERIHLQVEAMKIAMTDVRAHLGDPAFVSERAVAELLDRKRAAARGAQINPAQAGSYEPANLFAQAGTDTSYAAVIDADGNAVSLLQSVFHIFGSGEVIPGTGTLMNNRMTGFSLDPASPNVLEPGKRTMHTLNPLLVRKGGRTMMCLGTPGGPSQTYTNMELLMRVIDDGLDLQRAIDAPRWFVTPDGDLNVERSVSADVLARLAARGHRVADFPAHSASFGGAGIIRINAGNVREAAADPRRETYALAC